jgi:membrane fusion protein, multidrug efflux system
MKLKLYTTLLSVLIVLAILTGCSNTSIDKGAQLEKLKADQSTLAKQISKLEKEIALENPGVSTAKSKDVGVQEMAPRKFDHYLQTQGKIDSEDNIVVSAKSMGVITHVFVREGDQVSKGQTLAQIDNTLMIRSIEELKAGLELANTVYDRQKNLWDQKIGTEVQFLQAKNNKESLEKRLDTMNEQLDMTRIKSLINGTVDAVNVKVGENAAPGAPAFRVINTDKLKIVAGVSEAFITSIKKGNKVMVEISDTGKKIEATVSFVGRNIDQLSRTFPVEVALATSADLRPNMTAVIKVIFHSEPAALCVPVNVVQNINGEKVVYIVETTGTQQVARRKVVEVAGVYSNLAEIKSGIKSGDKVITVGYQGLNDGEFVKI